MAYSAIAYNFQAIFIKIVFGLIDSKPKIVNYDTCHSIEFAKNP
jgi:hypothetical protein